jgi:MFS superfamily sulfate permease-like transporter
MTHQPDFLVWNSTFWITLLAGPTIGLGVSMACAVLFLLYRSSRPTSVVLGRLPGTTIYRDVSRFEKAEETAGVLIFRFDAPLHFANKVSACMHTHLMAIVAMFTGSVYWRCVRMCFTWHCAIGGANSCVVRA